MAKRVEIGRVHGRSHTYTVVEYKKDVFGNDYYVVRDDGKSWGSYDSRAAAFRAAHEKAGPDAFES